MRFTSMRLSSRRRSGGAFLAFAFCIACGMAASCADDSVIGFDDADAASDASARSDGDTTTNGDATADTGPIPHDAGAFDATVRPIACASGPCAVSLTASTAFQYGNYITAGGQGFCALLQDGTVACWGANEAGQLGRGDDAGKLASATPARVIGLSNVVTLNRTCAVDKDGATWCWGTGPFLQSDAEAVTTASSPVKLPLPPVTHAATSPWTGCATVEGDGGALCWGSNVAGQIPGVGDDYVGNTLGYPATPIPIPPGAPIRDLHVGKASIALREDGTAWSWGSNPPLGRVTSLSPDPNADPLALADVTAISAATDNACAVANGIPYCWGSVPPTSAIASNTSLDRALPEPVVTPERVVHIAVTDHFVTMDDSLPRRWCAVGGSGAVYCWGNNANGQAGDGTTNYAANAVKVDLPSPAVQVATTLDTTCALLTSGKIHCWGGDFYGQLGNGKLKQQSLVPVEVLLP